MLLVTETQQVRLNKKFQDVDVPEAKQAAAIVFSAVRMVLEANGRKHGIPCLKIAEQRMAALVFFFPTPDQQPNLFDS